MPINFLVSSQPEIDNMDSRFRGNDESVTLYPCSETRRLVDERRYVGLELRE